MSSDDEESAVRTAEQISVDKTNHSVSFNEFLTLNGKIKTTTNPAELLLECFEVSAANDPSVFTSVSQSRRRPLPINWGLLLVETTSAFTFKILYSGR